MLDANPLRDCTMHPSVNISRNARNRLARHTNLRLEDRRRVHDDDLAFRFWIDGKLVNPSKINQISSDSSSNQVKIKCALFGRLFPRVVVPVDAR